MLPNVQNYESSEGSKHYFCHQCQAKFVKNLAPEAEFPESIECIVCKSDFCEETNEPMYSMERQRPVLPFFMRNPISIRRVLSNGQLIIEIRNFSNLRLPQQFLPFASSADQHFENLINHLMQNDPNKYGPPPASKSSVENLKSFQLNKEDIEKIEVSECTICKEFFTEEEDVKKMPCNHFFHNACLEKWLSQHNSCPICRFELETDDPDYENKKKQAN